MAGWYHQCNRYELGQTLGDGGDREAWLAVVHASQIVRNNWETEHQQLPVVEGQPSFPSRSKEWRSIPDEKRFRC